MKTRIKIIVYAFGCMLFTLACSEETKKKIKEAKQGVTATTSFVKNASTIQEDIERLQKLTPISNEKLKAWLPEKIGSLNRSGFKVGHTGYMKMTSVEGTYKAETGKKKISITVIDGAGPVGSVMAPSYSMISNVDAEMEDERKHQKNVTVNGIKAKQTFYKKRNTTHLMFLHQKRFLVTVNSTDMDVEETWNAMKKMNLNELADLAE